MDFVAVDIETTGFSQNYDSIIQIGAVKIVDDLPVDEMNVYIKVNKKVPKEVTEICKITNELLNEKGINYAVALQQFVDFVGDMELVAHNSTFDQRFLYEKIKKKTFHYLNNKFYCTVKLAKYKLPHLKNYKLDTVASELGIPNINHHHALNDAKVCADIMLVLGGKKAVFYTRKEEPQKVNGLLDAFVDMKKMGSKSWRDL